MTARIGDWVINASSRLGEIVKIVELKPGYRSVWVRYSGDNIEQRENPEDLTAIDPDDIPEQSQQKTSELIFNYLEQQSDFVPEIVIAVELNITVPVARQNLRELGERVEDDGHGNWRCVQSSVAEEVVEKTLGLGEEETRGDKRRQGEEGTGREGESLVTNPPVTKSPSHQVLFSPNLQVSPVECQHNWEFVSSPLEIGFAERCSHCHEVRYIETSDKLEELIAWLNHQVEEFEQLSDKEVDERRDSLKVRASRN